MRHGMGMCDDPAVCVSRQACACVYESVPYYIDRKAMPLEGQPHRR